MQPFWSRREAGEPLVLKSVLCGSSAEARDALQVCTCREKKKGWRSREANALRFSTHKMHTHSHTVKKIILLCHPDADTVYSPCHHTHVRCCGLRKQMRVTSKCNHLHTTMSITIFTSAHAVQLTRLNKIDAYTRTHLFAMCIWT